MIIRKLREDRGWSQEQLAEISGLSVRTIQRIESGGRASLETLKCLAAVFETSIPDLRKDSSMAEDDDKPMEQPHENGEKTPQGLSEEDRAALRYVRYLKRYDDWYDEEEADSWQHVPPEKRAILRQVRRERSFYISLLSYVVIIAFLAALNLLTNPGYLWFLWAAAGWGLAMVFQAVSVFGRYRLLGEDWERREVERRLQRLGERTRTGL